MIKDFTLIFIIVSLKNKSVIIEQLYVMRVIETGTSNFQLLANRAVTRTQTVNLIDKKVMYN